MCKIILLNDSASEKWDTYARHCPEGSFYHLTSWKKIIEKTFGFTPVYLMAISGSGGVCGILPMFLMKNILGKKYLISTPSSIYAGICADNNEVKAQLIKKAQETAIDNNIQYIEIRQLGPGLEDLPTIMDFVTMSLKLHSDHKQVWDNSLKSVTRNRIRKGYKQNLTIDHGKKYLDDFYRVFSINMRDLGTPVYPKAFFRNILEGLDTPADIIVVKHQNIVIGAMFYIGFNKVFINPWVSSLRKYSGLCPNDLLYWEAIKLACKNGYEHFDFGRSTINSGTYNFKKKWGAKPLQLNYQYYLNRTKKIPSVDANNNQYQMAIDLWKKLPVKVSNAIGPRLVPYLPEY